MTLKQRAIPNILVVDDEVEIAKILEKTLAPHGYNVFTAHNGSAALKIARKNNIELVLLDIHMPKMDGIELLGRFKMANPNLIVIVMTGVSTLKTAISAMKLGAYDYVTKPFELNFIVSIVEQALKQQGVLSESL